MWRITEIKQFFIRTGELTLEPGVYQYDFQAQLPTGIPTSLEAMHGHIRYGLQVVLDRPRWANQNFEATFTVIKPLNLNNDIALRVKSIFNYSNIPNAGNHLISEKHNSIFGLLPQKLKFSFYFCSYVQIAFSIQSLKRKPNVLIHTVCLCAVHRIHCS